MFCFSEGFSYRKTLMYCFAMALAPAKKLKNENRNAKFLLGYCLCKFIRSLLIWSLVVHFVLYIFLVIASLFSVFQKLALVLKIVCFKFSKEILSSTTELCRVAPLNNEVVQGCPFEQRSCAGNPAQLRCAGKSLPIEDCNHCLNFYISQEKV